MHQTSPPFAAFIGIDWADKKHDVCLPATLARYASNSVDGSGGLDVRPKTEPHN